MRLLEEHEERAEALRRALTEGEESGEYSLLDMQEMKRVALRQAGLEG